MLKTVVVKDKMIVADHTFEENIAGKYDDTYELFVFDDQFVPLFNFGGYTGPIIGINGPVTIVSPTIANRQPLSDPRLRISLEECKSITIGIIKEWCGNYILKEYPLFKQNNIMMRAGYSDADFTKMINFITAVRETSNKIEIRINAIAKDTNANKESILDIDYKAEIRSASTK